MEFALLLAEKTQQDGFAMWLSMILAAIGLVVILIQKKKKK